MTPAADGSGPTATEPATRRAPAAPPAAAEPPVARGARPLARRRRARGPRLAGREPEARASILYRLLRLVARFVIFVGFRFRIDAAGPRAAAAHAAATC